MAVFVFVVVIFLMGIIGGLIIGGIIDTARENARWERESVMRGYAEEVVGEDGESEWQWKRPEDVCKDVQNGK